MCQNIKKPLLKTLFWLSNILLNKNYILGNFVKKFEAFLNFLTENSALEIFKGLYLENKGL